MNDVESNKTKNKLVVAIYFLSSIIWLDIIDYSFVTDAVGISFIIAAVYGFVAVVKNKKFLF